MSDIQEKILELMDLFDDDEVTTANKIPRPQSSLDKEAFDDFNIRNPKVDGGRMEFKDGLSASQKKKIIEAFPETKFNFDEFKYGVKKYLTGNRNKANKDYTKVLRFVKKGFTKEMGKGLNVRGQPYSVEGKRLSLKDQEKIKSLFKLPPGEEWDFKTHKYGIKQEGRENLLKRMATAVRDKSPWKVAADFGSTEGWMILQMNRVFENETKAGVKSNKLTYQPQYKIINGRKRIIGFKDNTVAGGGKYYYGLNIHAKKNATNFTNHGDFKLNKKLVDISKRSFNQPNEVITGLLKKKGFTDKINLNQLINYLAGTEATSAENLRNAIVRHHNSGVAFGSATNDLSLTTQTINKKIVEAEKRIRANNILPEDVQLLKNNNIYVRSGDGKLYGAGSKTPIGQFKQIEKSVEEAVRSPNFKVKGLKSFMKANGIKCFVSKSTGGPVTCDMPQAYEKSLNQISKAAQAGDSAAQSKLLNFRKAVRGAGSVIKGVLGPAAIAAEIGIAIPIGLFDYAQGRPTEEIVNTLTYGLGGKSRQDRLKEQMPTYGQGDKLQTAFDTYLSTLNKQGLPRDPNELRPGIKTSQAINRFNKAREPFIRTNPQVEEGGFFDLDMFNRNVSESRALEQKLAEEDLKRQEQRKTPFDLSDPFMAADGGLSGGDKSGPPPESGPTPHGDEGLPGIFKRVKKQ